MLSSDDADLRDGERRVIADMWAFRARSENQAAARFVRLHQRLEAAALHPALTRIAAEAIEQERRHRTRCADLALRFGHPPLDAELVEGRVPEVAPHGLCDARRLTWEVVAFCCLTESINAALLTHSYALATDSDSKAAIREILADEVQHARLGWAFLSLTEDKAWLAPMLPRMLDATVPEELLDPRIRDTPSPALQGYGVFPRSDLSKLLVDTIEGVIRPGLDSLGVDSQGVVEWMQRSLPSHLT